MGLGITVVLATVLLPAWAWTLTPALGKKNFPPWLAATLSSLLFWVLCFSGIRAEAAGSAYGLAAVLACLFALGAALRKRHFAVWVPIMILVAGYPIAVALGLETREFSFPPPVDYYFYEIDIKAAWKVFASSVLGDFLGELMTLGLLLFLALLGYLHRPSHRPVVLTFCLTLLLCLIALPLTKAPSPPRHFAVPVALLVTWVTLLALDRNSWIRMGGFAGAILIVLGRLAA